MASPWSPAASIEEEENYDNNPKDDKATTTEMNNQVVVTSAPARRKRARSKGKAVAAEDEPSGQRGRSNELVAAEGEEQAESSNVPSNVDEVSSDFE